MYAITTLLIVVALSLLVTRAATVILTATGISKAEARFQARSAFTGSGFTTAESEDVVAHPVRRKVIMWLMFLGNAGIVAGAGTLIIGFRGGGVGPQWARLLELGIGLLALLFISRNDRVDRWLTRLMGRWIDRYTDLPTRDSDVLLELGDGFAVQEMLVGEDDWLAGRSVGRAALDEEGITLLGIKRRDVPYLAHPASNITILAGDTLILYGDGDRILLLDRRAAGPTAAADRAAAVADHRADLEDDAAGDAHG